MSRHRHVQNLDYDEEYDEAYDDAVYGRSVDEHEYGVSPSVESYLYGQNQNSYGMGACFAGDNIAEENEDKDDRETDRRSSTSSIRPRLSSEDEVRVNSILDEIRNAVGDEFSDSDMVRAVISCNYDFEKSLDLLLNMHIVNENDKKASASSTAIGGPPVPDCLHNTLNLSYMAPVSYSLSSAFIFDNMVRERIPIRKIVKEWYNAVVKNHKKDNLVTIPKNCISFSPSDSSVDHLPDRHGPTLNKSKDCARRTRDDSLNSNTSIDLPATDETLADNISGHILQQLPNDAGQPRDSKVKTSICSKQRKHKTPFHSSELKNKSEHSEITTTSNSLSSMAAAHLSKFNVSTSNTFIIPQFATKTNSASLNLPAFIVPKAATDEIISSSGPSLMGLANAHFSKINNSSSSMSNSYGSSPINDSSLTKSFNRMEIDADGGSKGFVIPPLITGSQNQSPFSMSTPKSQKKVCLEVNDTSEEDIDLTVALMRMRPAVEKKREPTVAEAVLSLRPLYSPEYPSTKLTPLSGLGRIICKTKFRRFKKKLKWTVIKTGFRPFSFKTLSPDELYAAALANALPSSAKLTDQSLRRTK